MYGWIPHLGLKQNIELNIMDMKLNAIVRKANRETRVYSSSSASSGGAQKSKEEKKKISEVSYTAFLFSWFLGEKCIFV